MAKKLVTICWSTTIEVEVPDDFNVSNAESNHGEFAARTACKAFDNLRGNDGEITDVQDTEAEDGPLTPDEEAELKAIIHKQNQRA